MPVQLDDRGVSGGALGEEVALDGQKVPCTDWVAPARSGRSPTGPTPARTGRSATASTMRVDAAKLRALVRGMARGDGLLRAAVAGSPGAAASRFSHFALVARSERAGAGERGLGRRLVADL